jgi:hypothetical protein
VSWYLHNDRINSFDRKDLTLVDFYSPSFPLPSYPSPPSLSPFLSEEEKPKIPNFKSSQISPLVSELREMALLSPGLFSEHAVRSC